MNEQELKEKIIEAERQGWKLCAGCIPNSDNDCASCGIETRKTIGLPPECKCNHEQTF